MFIYVAGRFLNLSHVMYVDAHPTMADGSVVARLSDGSSLTVSGEDAGKLIQHLSQRVVNQDPSE